MGDADNSYDFSNLMPFVDKLREGYELVKPAHIATDQIPRSGSHWLQTNWKATIKCLSDIRRALVFLMLLVFATVVLAYFHNRGWAPYDDGGYVHVAERILHGEVLNSDVQDIHMGYINFANAIALKLFGDDLVSLRYPLVIMGLLQAALIFWLLAGRGTWSAVIAFVAMTSLSFVQFPNPSAHWYALFLMVLVIACLSWLPPERRGRLELVGFLVVTLFLFRQLTGVIAAIGVITYLFCEEPRGGVGKQLWLGRALLAAMASGLAGYLITKTDPVAVLTFGLWPLGILLWSWLHATVRNRDIVPLLLRFSLGGLIAVLPLLTYHLYHGSLTSWLYDTVICAEAMTRLDFFDELRYWQYVVFGLYLVPHSQNIAQVSYGIFWSILPMLATLHGWLVLRALWRRERGHAERYSDRTPQIPVGPLPFLAVFYAIVSLHYQKYMYLFFTVGLTVSGLLWMTASARASLKWIALSVGFGLAVIGVVYSAGQGVRTVLHEQQVALVPSSGLDRCSLWMTPEEVEFYAYVVDLVERQVSPSESILALPYHPELYYLTRRRNPTRFFNSAFGLRSEDDVKQLLAKIDEAPPVLVFFTPDSNYTTNHSLQVMRAIRQRYELIEVKRGFEIYRISG